MNAVRVKALAVVAVLGIVSVGATLASDAGRGFAVGAVSVRVQGSQLVDGGGRPVRLLGVNRSGTEYMCIDDVGIFDGPSDPAAIAAIASWHTDAVRVPLNEDCWLGINGVNSSYGGQSYRNAIADYVTALHQAGQVAILDLHWSAPGAAKADDQQVMADADHSPAFWSSVASFFKADPGVVFDLYNEPHDISPACWRDGCTSTQGWQTAGMQSLVDAVRATGATQPVMVAGLAWATDLSQWLSFRPSDPLNQVVASVHLYSFGGCNTQSCWESQVAPVASHVPVVTGELGENDCAAGFISTYMAWADAHGVSYLGWTWDAGGGWTCQGAPVLITSYDGTPTGFGVGLRDHLGQLSATSTSSSDSASSTSVTSPPPPPASSSTTAAPRTTTTSRSTTTMASAPTTTTAPPRRRQHHPRSLSMSSFWRYARIVFGWAA